MTFFHFMNTIQWGKPMSYLYHFSFHEHNRMGTNVLLPLLIIYAILPSCSCYGLVIVCSTLIYSTLVLEYNLATHVTSSYFTINLHLHTHPFFRFHTSLPLKSHYLYDWLATFTSHKNDSIFPPLLHLFHYFLYIIL